MLRSLMRQKKLVRLIYAMEKPDSHIVTLRKSILLYAQLGVRLDVCFTIPFFGTAFSATTPPHFGPDF